MGFGRRRALSVGVTLLASIALLCASASSASALSIGLMWNGDLSQSESATEMDILKNSGSTIYRLALDRNQTADGSDWSKYDTIIDRAARRGITVLPYLEGNAEGRFPYASEYTSWQGWVKKAVKRYGYNGEFWTANPSTPYTPVTAWEIWNEPNLKIENPKSVGRIEMG